jgi:hypothetical protein
MRSSPLQRLRELVGVPELSIVLVSYGLFLFYLSGSWDTSFFDENHYLSLARLLWEEGPFAETELHAQRTYLYPWLLSGLMLLTGWDPPMLKTLVAMLQYTALLAAVAALAICSDPGTAPRAATARRAVLVAGLWNPYLVQATVLLLTDALAACAVAGSVLAAWRCDVARLRGVMSSIGLAAAAAMLRPAALPALGFVAGTLVLRAWLRRDVALGALMLRSPLGLLPMLPQLVLNVLYFGSWSVLPEIPMYRIQQVWAIHRLRWLTSVDPRSPGGIAYLNPVPVEPGTTLGSAILHDPLAFAVAYGAHWFHILDWGYIDIYVDDLYAPSRLVGSVFVYSVWALVVWGAIAVWRQRGRSHDRDGQWLVLGAATLAYCAFIATTQMETRYAYPAMLLALPFVGPGAVAVIERLGGGSAPRRIPLAVLIHLAGCLGLLALSLRLDRTTHRIDWFAHYFG